jgi:hypothetical protein
MDLPAILARLDHERRHLARDGETLTRLPQLSRLRIGESIHLIPSSSLTADTAPAAIEQEIAHHRALGVGFEWKLYTHDAPPHLLSLLQRSGFSIGETEAVMIYDLSDAPLPPSGHEVRRITDPAQFADFLLVADDVETYDCTQIVAHLKQALADRSTQHLAYITYVNDEPAAIARLHTHPDAHFAGLYGGSTRPAFRSRGLYRALVSARAADAMKLGARYLLVDALPTSRPILERLGFHHLTDTIPCEWRPTPAAPI